MANQAPNASQTKVAASQPQPAPPDSATPLPRCVNSAKKSLGQVLAETLNGMIQGQRPFDWRKTSGDLRRAYQTAAVRVLRHVGYDGPFPDSVESPAIVGPVRGARPNVPQGGTLTVPGVASMTQFQPLSGRPS